VRDAAAVEAAVAAAVDTFGRIDVVHNNAGYGVFGAVEEVTDEQARGIFDTNVFGVLNVLRATLPVLRAQQAGHILQGSSFYGQSAHPGVGLLCATKYAVEGLTDALAGELEPLGIKVTMVEPGATATPFGSNFVAAAGTIADYDQTVREVAKATAALPPSAYDDPDRVAAAILVAVDAPARRCASPPARAGSTSCATPCAAASTSRRRGGRRPRPWTPRPPPCREPRPRRHRRPAPAPDQGADQGRHGREQPPRRGG
jgi:NAD(P)-dependent dehydrogenase (short-subunit alcohol dehydrogenase family)